MTDRVRFQVTFEALPWEGGPRPARRLARLVKYALRTLGLKNVGHRQVAPEGGAMDLTLVTFLYRNHRGEEALRRVRPIRLWFGSTCYHPEPQWLLEAFDVDRMATRSFAMSNILGPLERLEKWKEVAPDAQMAPDAPVD